MKTTDVIIIGAGAAGLMAAHILTKKEKKVTVLEARNRIGGRIHTINSDGFSKPVELGAEFVHGNLPVTLDLLQDAGIKYSRAGFEMWQHHNGTFEQNEEFIEGWDLLLEKLNRLEHDMTMHDFLEEHFDDERYFKMRTQIENFVAGYDTADIHDVSAFALREEWNSQDEDDQYRLENGYCTLMDFLAKGLEIHLNSVAREVNWGEGNVKIVTAANTIYEAPKVIIALPLGILQAPESTVGAILFNPPLPEQTQAFNGIGFGSVVKILLEFDEPFWKSDKIKQLTGADLSKMGFLFSDEEIPTYWTQEPENSALLTGWIGGPPAYAKRGMTPEAIMEQTVKSLAKVFKLNPAHLKSRIIAWHVANWSNEPFTLGSYAYEKVESPQARNVLMYPIADTIYFAGEYLYDGPSIGTVEAALTSGKETAEKLAKN